MIITLNHETIIQKTYNARKVANDARLGSHHRVLLEAKRSMELLFNIRVKLVFEMCVASEVGKVFVSCLCVQALRSESQLSFSLAPLKLDPGRVLGKVLGRVL